MKQHVIAQGGVLLLPVLSSEKHIQKADHGHVLILFSRALCQTTLLGFCHHWDLLVVSWELANHQFAATTQSVIALLR